MSDTDWINCPQCGLKHRRRPDGMCPKCHQDVTKPAAAVPQPDAGITSELTVCQMDQGRLVVISDDAILVVSPPSRQLGAMGGLIGGALGAVVATAIEHRLDKAPSKNEAEDPHPSSVALTLAGLDRALVTTVAQVPADLRTNASWPKGCAPTDTVRILPKAAIVSVSVSMLNGLHLRISKPTGPEAQQMGITPEGRTQVGLAAWHVGKVRRHLERAGYRLG